MKERKREICRKGRGRGKRGEEDKRIRKEKERGD